MITHPSDDLAARGAIAFCRHLSAVKDETGKPEIAKAEPAPKTSPLAAVVFRANGAVERYPLVV